MCALLSQYNLELSEGLTPFSRRTDFSGGPDLGMTQGPREVVPPENTNQEQDCVG
jgi:hypothetical protein